MRPGLIMVCDVDLAEANATRIHTTEVARGFATEGLEVDLVTRGPDPAVEGVRFHRALGTDHERLRRLASLNLHSLRLLWRRRRVARRLYVRHRWSLMLVLLLGRMLGYRVVTQVDDIPYGRGHEPDISPVSDYGQRLCAWLMGRLVHGVVAVTPQIKHLLRVQFRVPGERIAVLPNGVDVDFFHPLSREEAISRLGLDPHAAYLLFCGHFAPWVDFDTLLGGFAAALDARPNAHLLLVGDGGERERVEELARAYGIEHAVSITGFISDRATVRDYIAAATVALSANRPEHRSRIGVSPVKVAEYLACGRAVLATDLPGLREALEATGAGRVVAVDAESMGEAMIALLGSEVADAMGARGRAVATERFSWPLIVRRTLPLFSQEPVLPAAGRAASP